MIATLFSPAAAIVDELAGWTDSMVFHCSHDRSAEGTGSEGFKSSGTLVLSVVLSPVILAYKLLCTTGWLNRYLFIVEETWQNRGIFVKRPTVGIYALQN